MHLYASESYLKLAVESGRLLVNGKSPNLQDPLHNGDVISHKVHRHEAPVFDVTYEILGQMHGITAINKPVSVPVHVCSKYMHNTLAGLLRSSNHWTSIDSLHPLNRLDRPVSGIVLYASNGADAKRIQAELLSGSVRKVYLAEVEGEFPADTTRIDCQNFIGQMPGQWKMQVYEAEEQKNNVADDDVGGSGRKAAYTIFWHLHSDRGRSWLLCFPQTGRTHQLRVHLSHLGHPIVGDSVYGAQALSGGHPRLTEADQAAIKSFCEGEDNNNNNCIAWCPHCQQDGYEARPSEMSAIHLHSLYYGGREWEFESPLPAWGKEVVLPVDYPTIVATSAVISE